MKSERFSLYERFGKRTFDVVLTLFFVPALLPLAILAAGLVRSSLGAPIIFRQQRIGRHSRPFVLLKFRTMAEIDAADSDRVSGVGALLRRTSLDEIPEFVNILRGEMSLVGPRPLLPEYVPLYSARQSRRHEVTPGLTGLAQVRGRNETTWERRLELDVEYVDRLSFRLDLSILLTTCWMILTGRGVSAPGHATMPRFRGSASEDGEVALEPVQTDHELEPGVDSSRGT